MDQPYQIAIRNNQHINVAEQRIKNILKIDVGERMDLKKKQFHKINKLSK